MQEKHIAAKLNSNVRQEKALPSLKVSAIHPLRSGVILRKYSVPNGMPSVAAAFDQTEWTDSNKLSFKDKYYIYVIAL